MPVLLNFVLYLYFINNFHFVSRSLLKIRGKTDSKIDLRPHLIKCFRFLVLFFFFFSGQPVVSLLVLFSV